jgi:hypothetical protein
VPSWGDDAGIPHWKQSGAGHPGNWNLQNVEFCLKTFVDVSIKIQGAQWIPRAIERDLLYGQQIEAINDRVEVWSYVKKDAEGKILSGFEGILRGTTEREVIRILGRGETMRATVRISTESSGNTLQDRLSGGGIQNAKVLSLMGQDDEGFFYGYLSASDVRVTCVPKNVKYVKEYFPRLPTIE